MASCGTVRQFLIDYLDGRLAGEFRWEVDAHLEGCAACRAEAGSLRLTWDLLRVYPSVEPSPDFLGRVKSRLHPARGRFLRWAGTVAAAAAVLLIVVTVAIVDGPDGADREFRGLPASDQVLLSELAQEDQWDLVENADLIRAMEILDRENSEFLPPDPAGEGH